MFGSRRLLAPEGEGGIGGAPAEPRILTEEDVSRIVNAAVTGHLKRELPKSITAAIGPALEAALKPIQEQFATKPAQPESAADPKASPEFAAMRRQLDEQKTIIEAERGARLQAEQRQRQDSARASILSQIDPAVKPELKEFLSDYLFNRTQFDESGAPLIRVIGDEPLPLKDGIASFLKSKEASAFLPAPGAAKLSVNSPKGQPSIAQRQQGQPTYDKPATTEEEKVRRAYEREQALEQAAANG
jgi:hypothetical protein